MSAAKKEKIVTTDPQELLKIIAAKDQRIAALEEYIRLDKLRRFGASSEKSPDQSELFNEAELSSEADGLLVETDEVATPETPAASVSSKKRGRKPLPADLPRVRIEHDVADSERICPCGCARKVIGEECSEQLDIIPAKIRVLLHVRKKYACPACEEGVVLAALPAQPIPKSNASAGLLAHVAVGKYQDALPLYRQETILARHGIDIPRNTLAHWMIKSGHLVQPLIDVLEIHLLRYPVMHCDETTVQVLKEPDKLPSSKSYMWVRVGGPPTQSVRLFNYARNRSGDVACELLRDYQGYVQTDDYAGYNAACLSSSITQLGCWAHARRKFIEAQKASSPKAGKADMAVSLIAKLYAVEKLAKGKSAEDIYTLRQENAVPQLEKIRQWLDATLHQTLPKGLLGKALSYLDKNWQKLTVYTQDGRLSIDNNPAENAIRPFVIGRKNWLFSASMDGAKASANLYSLIETAKANGLEPYAYLRKVFTDLPSAQGEADMTALLPWNVELQDGVN